MMNSTAYLEITSKIQELKNLIKKHYDRDCDLILNVSPELYRDMLHDITSSFDYMKNKSVLGDSYRLYFNADLLIKYKSY